MSSDKYPADASERTDERYRYLRREGREGGILKAGGKDWNITGAISTVTCSFGIMVIGTTHQVDFFFSTLPCINNLTFQSSPASFRSK